MRSTPERTWPVSIRQPDMQSVRMRERRRQEMKWSSISPSSCGQESTVIDTISRGPQLMLAEVEPRLRKDLLPGHYAFGMLLSQRSLLALERGDTAKALQLVDQSIDALQATINAGKAGVNVLPLYYQRRGLIELQAGRPDAAVADMTKALELFQADMSRGVFSYRTGRAYLFLEARALKAQGKEEDARAAARTAAEHLQSAAGLDHPDTRSARQLAGLDPSGQ